MNLRSGGKENRTVSLSEGGGSDKLDPGKFPSGALARAGPSRSLAVEEDVMADEPQGTSAEKAPETPAQPDVVLNEQGAHAAYANFARVTAT